MRLIRLSAQRYRFPMMLGAAVALVEAAYSFAEDERAWLRGLASAAGGLFPSASAVIAFTYDARRRRTADWLDPPVPGEHGELLAAGVVASHRRRSGGTRVLPYLDPRSVSTSSELFTHDPGAPRNDPGAEAGEKLGIRDLLRVKACAGDGVGVVLAAALDRRTRVDRATASRWRRLVAHLAAGLRIRRMLALPSAIFDNAARLVHTSAGLPQSTLARLREHVVALDRARARGGQEALDTWTALARGDWSLVDRFDRDGRRFWVARYLGAPQADPRRLGPREWAVATLVSRGESNKATAIALGVSEGTVAAHLASVRKKLGGVPREAIAGLLTTPDAARMTSLRIGADELVTVSAVRRDGASSLFRGLTVAEVSVVEAVAQGASSKSIAAHRGTSVHTVNHQVHSAFRKLGVVSRGELSRLLAGGVP